MIEITKADYDKIEDKMKKCIENLQENLNAIRAGRANPHVLDKIKVDYYGAPSPLNAVANIQVPEARMITLTPWDPSMLKEIEKAIQSSDLGITPTNDGKIIRLVFPILTEDRRKDLVKQVKTYGEECKVVIRNVRREAIDKMRSANKKKELTDDSLKEYEEKIQKITDKFTKDVDSTCDNKEKELMEI
ncbi:MAG TPA: ribosome recycling factor [Clostridiales bacterium]|nr:ribosome recycling factor [Clostridiales bacterium]